MMIAITGASGLVGKRLTALLRDRGDQVRAISTRGDVRAADLEGCDAVVNLAGEPVAQRWTAAAKDRIRSSRVEGTRRIVDAIGAIENRPRVLVNASAMGIYGSGFLKEVVEAWEREANRAAEFGVRVVLVRFTTVLARDGGALKKMLLPFRLGIGGRIGDGRQWMSWIHVGDAARLIEFAIRNASLNGPVDAASPNPVRNAEFTRELARAVHRPAVFPVPKLALRVVFGEMAEMVYASERVMPEAAMRAGFEFRFPELRAALENILAANARE
jgi:hypothetical protein